MLNSIILILVLGLVSTLSARDLPQPSELKIGSVDYFGSGCKPNSVATQLSSDGQAVTVLFSDFTIETRSKIERVQLPHKQCMMKLKMRVPRGWSFALFNLDFRGYAKLEKDVTAIQSASYKFEHGPLKHLGIQKIEGVYDDDYAFRESAKLEETHWSKCGKGREDDLWISTSILLKAKKGAHGMMAVDSIDGELKHKYGVKWRKCKD